MKVAVHQEGLPGNRQQQPAAELLKALRLLRPDETNEVLGFALLDLCSIGAPRISIAHVPLDLIISINCILFSDFFLLMSRKEIFPL